MIRLFNYLLGRPQSLPLLEAWPDGMSKDRFGFITIDCTKFPLDQYDVSNLGAFFRNIVPRVEPNLPHDVNGIWVKCPQEKFDLISRLLKSGFKFHRIDSRPDFLWMILELTAQHRAPSVGSASIGCSGLFMDEDLNVLWVEAKTRPGKLGLPGGIAEHGEGPVTALCREVEEEVGYRIPPASRFIVALTVVQEAFRYDQVDLYFTLQVLLPKGLKLPKSSELKLQESELIKAGSMPFSEFMKAPESAKDYGEMADKLVSNAQSFYSDGTTQYGVFLRPRDPKKLRASRFYL
jgi:8-oxo-dGTP pyrophosphatase MutT (NUDIX family)